jgi:hypothetical protein
MLEFIPYFLLIILVIYLTYLVGKYGEKVKYLKKKVSDTISEYEEYENQYLYGNIDNYNLNILFTDIRSSLYTDNKFKEYIYRMLEEKILKAYFCLVETFKIYNNNLFKKNFVIDEILDKKLEKYSYFITKLEEANDKFYEFIFNINNLYEEGMCKNSDMEYEENRKLDNLNLNSIKLIGITIDNQEPTKYISVCNLIFFHWLYKSNYKNIIIENADEIIEEYNKLVEINEKSD